MSKYRSVAYSASQIDSESDGGGGVTELCVQGVQV